MKKTVVAAISASLFLGSLGLAQVSERDRAQGAMDSLGAVTDILTQGIMEDTVVPFETATPPESTLTEPEFDDAQFAIQTGSGADSRMFSATVDSALNRPDVTIDPNSLDLADSAIEQSDAVVGGLFTADGGTCEAIFDGGSYNGIRICQAILSRRLETCQETRNISVDRDDTWSCDVEEPTYRKQCERNITWACTGSSGSSCIKSAVSFTPAPVWTVGDEIADISFGAINNGVCSLKTHTVFVQSRDYVNLSFLDLSDLTFQGVAQIRVDGVNVWTYGTAATGDLVLGDRDCGKRCSRRAVYAGSTWIEDCGTATVISQPNADILASLNVPVLGPPSDLNTLPVIVSTGAATNQVRIDIITGNDSETSMDTTFKMGGQCCSAISANLGDQC